MSSPRLPWTVARGLGHSARGPERHASCSLSSVLDVVRLTDGRVGGRRAMSGPRPLWSSRRQTAPWEDAAPFRALSRSGPWPRAKSCSAQGSGAARQLRPISAPCQPLRARAATSGMQPTHRAGRDGRFEACFGLCVIGAAAVPSPWLREPASSTGSCCKNVARDGDPVATGVGPQPC